VAAILPILVGSGCGGLPPSGWDIGAGGARDEAGEATVADLPSPLVVEVTGRDFQWHFRYPGSDGAQGTLDDRYATRDLHLPAGARVRLELRSEDALYFFGVPALGLKQIAVPDMNFALDVETGAASTFDLRGDEMCGLSHPELVGDLVIEPPPEFVDWLNRLERFPPSMARDG